MLVRVWETHVFIYMVDSFAYVFDGVEDFVLLIGVLRIGGV